MTTNDVVAVKQIPLRYINLGLTLLFTIYVYWLTSEHTWLPDHISKLNPGSEFYYWSQAKDLWNGHLYVSAGNWRWLECFIIAGECYGYFGIAPSLIRIPAVAIFRDQVNGLVPVFLALAIGLGFWAAIDLVRQVISGYFKKYPPPSRGFALRWMVLTAVLLGPGSVLVITARARVYEEAVAWGAAFLCLTINLIYRWSKSRGNLILTAAVVSGILAALSRPSSIPATIVLGLLVLVIAWKSGGVKVYTLGVLLIIAPVAIYIYIFVSKFGSLSFPWKVYAPYYIMPGFRNVIDANQGGTVGLRYAPTTLFNYFRFDSISFDWSSPWVTLKSSFEIIAPANARQIWALSVPSLTNMMPGPLILTIIALVSQVVQITKRRLRGTDLVPAGLLVAACSAGVPMIMYYALAGRYLADLYPLMVVGTAFSLPIIFDWTRKRKWWGRAIFSFLTVLAVVSSFVLFQIQEIIL